MIGDKLIVSAAPGTQIASYPEPVVSSQSDSFLIEIFIKKFFSCCFIYFFRCFGRLYESLYRKNN